MQIVDFVEGIVIVISHHLNIQNIKKKKKTQAILAAIFKVHSFSFIDQHLVGYNRKLQY